MNALAEFIVRGRWQAVLVTAACGTMTFLLPPVGTLLNYLAAAAVSLVALHVGALQGLQVLVIAVAASGLLYLLLGIHPAVVAIMAALLWLPCWLLAVVLLYARRLEPVLLAAVLFGALLLVAVYVLFGDPAPWWIERLQALRGFLEENGLPATNLADNEVLAALASLLTGLVLASLLTGILGSLLLARWWQSRLVRPGAFRDEFCAIRPGRAVGVVTLAMMLTAHFATGIAGDFTAQLSMIMLVPYLLVGLAVLHSLLSNSRRGKFWLGFVYVLLALLPQATLLLAGGGLLDTWVDFRKRVRTGSNRTEQ